MREMSSAMKANTTGEWRHREPAHSKARRAGGTRGHGASELARLALSKRRMPVRLETGSVTDTIAC